MTSIAEVVSNVLHPKPSLEPTLRAQPRGSGQTPAQPSPPDAPGPPRAPRQQRFEEPRKSWAAESQAGRPVALGSAAEQAEKARRGGALGMGGEKGGMGGVEGWRLGSGL